MNTVTEWKKTSPTGRFDFIRNPTKLKRKTKALFHISSIACVWVVATNFSFRIQRICGFSVWRYNEHSSTNITISLCKKANNDVCMWGGFFRTCICIYKGATYRIKKWIILPLYYTYDSALLYLLCVLHYNESSPPFLPFKIDLQSC